MQLPFTFDLPPSVALILSAFVLSLGLSLMSLLYNRQGLRAELDEEDSVSLLDSPSSIIPHIEELRFRLFRGALGVVVGAAVGMLLSDQILDVLTLPIGGKDRLLAIGVTEPLSVYFRVALVSGAIIAAPYVLAQLWIFIASGLRRSEQRAFYLAFPMAIVLFLSGVAFAYFVMLPVAVPFLTNVMGFKTTPTPSDYLKFVMSVLFWMGVAFELPMVVFILARLGLVNAAMLVRNWRISIVLIAVVAAVVTPTADPVNMAIVMAPLTALYILSIILAIFAYRKRSP